MHVKAACIALCLVLTGCSFGAPGDPPDEAVRPPGPATSEAEEGGDDTTVARTTVEIEGECTPEPQVEDGRQVLIAKLGVVNTGNIGAKARVTVTWRRVPASRVVTSRVMSVESGETAPLEVRLSVSRHEARTVRRAVKLGRKCFVRHRIIGAFGTPTD